MAGGGVKLTASITADHLRQGDDNEYFISWPQPLDVSLGAAVIAPVLVHVLPLPVVGARRAVFLAIQGQLALFGVLRLASRVLVILPVRGVGPALPSVVFFLVLGSQLHAMFQLPLNQAEGGHARDGLVKPCGDSFTITVTTPSCCRNSPTTSPSCWIKKAEDITELNVC
uniref:Uncharacterized protein n=1 Tax=Aegilops tauschii TaxID=37682 RepID=M8BN20_AEGTA